MRARPPCRALPSPVAFGSSLECPSEPISPAFAWCARQPCWKTKISVSPTLRTVRVMSRSRPSTGLSVANWELHLASFARDSNRLPLEPHTASDDIHVGSFSFLRNRASPMSTSQASCQGVTTTFPIFLRSSINLNASATLSIDTLWPMRTSTFPSATSAIKRLILETI